MRDDVALRFVQVAEAIRNLDISVLWAEATDDERRVLIEELSKVSVSIRTIFRWRSPALPHST
jgi:hypothetical protein